MKIVQFPESILSTPSGEILTFSSPLCALAKKMLDVMYRSNGVGLAGPQVGVPLRIAVIDIGDGPLVLVNPKVIASSGKMLRAEGCLSFEEPNRVKGTTRRAKKVIVEYQDLLGNTQRIQANNNLLSQALQHEIDHLNGILFTSRIKDDK